MIEEETKYNSDPRMVKDLNATTQEKDNISELLKIYMEAHGLKMDADTLDVPLDTIDEASQRDNVSFVIVRDYISLCVSVEKKFDAES
jgi:hypothetical protein